jgi:pimeloyl-ACP methyl ester carboxylesterase
MKNLLFLHGMPNTAKSVSDVVRELSKKYSVINFDWMDNKSNLSELTDKFKEYVDSLDEYSIFGMDWGGIIGPRVAYKFGKVDKIILCNTGLPDTQGCEFVFKNKPIEHHIKNTTIEEFEHSLNNLSNGNAFINWVSYVQTNDVLNMKKIISILTYYDHNVDLSDFVIHKDLPLLMDKDLKTSDLVKKFLENFNNVFYIGSKNDPISSEGHKSFHFAKKKFFIHDSGHLSNLDQPKQLVKIITTILENE